MEGKKLNAARFTGFADIYEEARPAVPGYPVEIIKNYLGRTPKVVIDLGCGTGLSTAIWRGNSEEVIGIEPSEDMLAVAKKKEGNGCTFLQAFSDHTGLENELADVVVCSQSFHWMEPVQTLQEVNRILKQDGIFAAIDYDWPPVCNWEAELAYKQLFDKVREIEKTYLKNSYVRYDKNFHLQNIKDSKFFRYTREIVFVNQETCTAKRFIGIALSQGSLQTILKRRPELIQDEMKDFEEKIKEIFGEDIFRMDFCYRMRIGIK